MHFWNLITIARIEKNLTQKALAELAEVSAFTISRYEAGYDIKEKTERAIVRALELDRPRIDRLLRLEGKVPGCISSVGQRTDRKDSTC